MPRSSRYLAPRASLNFYRAVAFAAEIGEPLNEWVTINFGLTACDEERMTEAFARLRKSFFGKWFVRHPHVEASGVQRAYFAWVAEGRPGHHGVHWLVHMPPAMRAEFRQLLPLWVTLTAGEILDLKAIQAKEAWEPLGAANYCQKGLTKRQCARRGLKHAYQGIVYGKRCGESESLGPTAIKRYREIERSRSGSHSVQGAA